MVLGFQGAAPGPGQPAAFKSFRERLWRHARRVVAEDSPDYFGFGENDLAFTRRHTFMPRAFHFVAVTETASGLSECHAAAQSSPCLVSKVFQEERIHRALEADMQGA